MAGSAPAKNRVLSVFSLVMINVIAVDSVRTLPFSAKLGLPLISYYLFVALAFFLPVAFVTAELATTWPKRGGIYVWVREAFGLQFGFLVVWLQWVYNLVWYPTILAIISLIVAFLMDSPEIASPGVTYAVVLAVFWLSTLGNCFGMELSSRISIFCTWVGTLIPMFLIIVLGAWWVIFESSAPQVELSWQGIIPKISSVEDLALITVVMFGVMGLEMSAVHAQEVKDPKRGYPKALKYSSIIILLTLMFGSLSIVLVVPENELNIVTGSVQAFRYFFSSLGISWMLPIMAIAIIIGAIGSIAAWIIGPTKALLVAAQEDNLPKIFAKTNKHGVPVAILIGQGIIVSILSLLYVALPTVETAYFLLTQLTAILALLMHVLFFCAAIRLRYKEPDIERPYKIPGGNWGMWIVCSIGGTCSFFAMLLGFLPPSQIVTGDPMTYKMILVGGVTIFCLPAYFIHRRTKQRRLAVR